MGLQKGIGVYFLLAAGVWAGDTTVYTVGVDSKTGKLVRVPATRYSRPVSSRAVAEKPVKEQVIEAREVGVEPARKPSQPAPVYNVASGRSFDKLIEQVALDYEIRPSFVHAVIKAESNYNPRAVSPKGALGLMQLVPKTARRFGVANAFNPVENVEGGVRYLRYLLDLYNSDVRLALAAYNAGEGAVDRYRGVPPYSETMQYVRRVRNLWDSYKRTDVPLAPEPAPKKLEGPRIVLTRDASGVERYVTETQ